MVGFLSRAALLRTPWVSLLAQCDVRSATSCDLPLTEAKCAIISYNVLQLAAHCDRIVIRADLQLRNGGESSELQPSQRAKLCPQTPSFGLVTPSGSEPRTPTQPAQDCSSSYSNVSLLSS